MSTASLATIEVAPPSRKHPLIEKVAAIGQRWSKAFGNSEVLFCHQLTRSVGSNLRTNLIRRLPMSLLFASGFA